MEAGIQRKAVLWKFDLCNPFCVLTLQGFRNISSGLNCLINLISSNFYIENVIVLLFQSHKL